MFIYQYLKYPKYTGAICKSSLKLGEKITDINLDKAKNIIEIGAGSGAFTQLILKKKAFDSSFFAIEINPNLAKNLKNKFQHLDIQVGNAKRIKIYMQKRQMPQACAIISSIPWALLSDIEQEALILEIYGALKEGGIFATFAYILPTLKAKNFKKQLFCIFSEVKKSPIIWQNVPPAFVYYCKK